MCLQLILLIPFRQTCENFTINNPSEIYLTINKNELLTRVTQMSNFVVVDFFLLFSASIRGSYAYKLWRPRNLANPNNIYYSSSVITLTSFFSVTLAPGSISMRATSLEPVQLHAKVRGVRPSYIDIAYSKGTYEYR